MIGETGERKSAVATPDGKSRKKKKKNARLSGTLDIEDSWRDRLLQKTSKWSTVNIEIIIIILLPLHLIPTFMWGRCTMT